MYVIDNKFYSTLFYSNDMETFFTDQKWNTLKFINKLYTDSHDEVT